MVIKDRFSGIMSKSWIKAKTIAQDVKTTVQDPNFADKMLTKADDGLDNLGHKCNEGFDNFGNKCKEFTNNIKDSEYRSNWVVTFNKLNVILYFENFDLKKTNLSKKVRIFLKV